MDTGSKGVIVGLTADTTVGELYRACMEGVVYEMMVNMEYLQPAGIQIQKLHATGGGARSGEWLQIDVYKRQLQRSQFIDVRCNLFSIC